MHRFVELCAFKVEIAYFKQIIAFWHPPSQMSSTKIHYPYSVKTTSLGHYTAEPDKDPFIWKCNKIRWIGRFYFPGAYLIYIAHFILLQPYFLKSYKFIYIFLQIKIWCHSLEGHTRADHPLHPLLAMPLRQ